MMHGQKNIKLRRGLFGLYSSELWQPAVLWSCTDVLEVMLPLPS